MPFYCFKSDNNVMVERFFRMGDAPEVITLEDGTSVRRDFQAEGVTGQMVGTDNPTRIRKGPVRPWPMKPCVGSGVHESQAQDLRDHFKKHNVDVEVTTDGDPIYTSAAQRKRALECRGMHDRASFN